MQNERDKILRFSISARVTRSTGQGVNQDIIHTLYVLNVFRVVKRETIKPGVEVGSAKNEKRSVGYGYGQKEKKEEKRKEKNTQ